MARSKRRPVGGVLRETAPARYAAAQAPAEPAGLLLDSDVIIAILRGRPRTVTALETLAASGIAGLQLWTMNRRHYPMPDLRFYSPH